MSIELKWINECDFSTIDSATSLPFTDRISKTLSEMLDQARDKGRIRIVAGKYFVSRELLAAFEHVYRKVSRHNLSNNIKKKDYKAANVLKLRDLQTNFIPLEVFDLDNVYKRYRKITLDEMDQIISIVEVLVAYQKFLIQETNRTLDKMLDQAKRKGFIDIDASDYYLPPGLVRKIIDTFEKMTGYSLDRGINLKESSYRFTAYKMNLGEEFYLKYNPFIIRHMNYELVTVIDENILMKIVEINMLLTKHQRYIKCIKQEQKAIKVPLIQKIINFFKRRLFKV
jgi:hypothetical protein